MTALSTQASPANGTDRPRVSLVVVGHVDHGKSTLIGRLLADAGCLPEGKLEDIRRRCLRNAKPMEYAYLLDALKEEQSQGITLDCARCFFKTARRDYVLMDAPGHVDLLKNMVSGAARADAAVLVIDAHEGIRENSRRHGYFLSMLGIDSFIVVINKMDRVGYQRKVFQNLENGYRTFLEQIRLKPLAFVPASASQGANVVVRSPELSWYEGPTVLDLIESFPPPQDTLNDPLRLPVQGVYKFTGGGDDRRIIAGRVESGVLRAGDRILFFPSNKRAVVKTVEGFPHATASSVEAGQPAGITLEEHVVVARGDVISRQDQTPPQVSSRFRVDLFWLGGIPATPEKTYKLKLAAAETTVQVERVIRILDASTLDVTEDRTDIRRNEVAECVLRARKPIAFDPAGLSVKTGRFVLVDGYAIAGGGIIREALPDGEADLKQEAFVRDAKWIGSPITPAIRAERYAQQAALVVITGSKGSGRKRLAQALEWHLFNQGRQVYYLAMGSVVHGLGADIAKSVTQERPHEHIRRLGETLHVLLDAGLIVICTALDLSPQDLQDIRTLIAPARIVSVSMGDGVRQADLNFPSPCDVPEAVSELARQLKNAGVLSEPPAT